MGDKKQIEALRKLADACTKMADVMENESATSEQVEQATGAFMIAIMQINALQ